MKRVLLLTLLVCSIGSYGQSCFTLRYFGLTVHPWGDDQAALQPYKLDKRAHFVMNFGGFVGYEKYLYRDMIAVKVLQGGFTDCSAGWAGFTHLGSRTTLLKVKNHKIMLGFGPTLYYRQDWMRLPNYEDSKLFHRTEIRGVSVQYYMFWYGVEFEYDCRINDKLDFNLGFTPGIPLALTFSFGVKYWLKREFKEKKEKFVIPPKKDS